MERELAEHDDREGWKHVKTEWLFSRLLEEVEEVRQVLIDLDRDAAGIQERAAERIGPEAADVANFCMFIADVCGALTTEAK
jgi:NTP pyrophosphatase (non-canonical NTP hydrolase)